MKQYRNYLFDLYGTLVDVHTDEDKDDLWWRLSVLLATEGAVCSPERLRQIYRTEVKARERADREVRGAWAEIDIAPVFAAMYEAGGVCPTQERIAQTAKLFRLFSLEKLRLFPGTHEMLERLKAAGKRVYLLSNAQALFTLPELGALGLRPYFDGIVISSCEGWKKPDTALYLRALERFELNAAETVMVGNDDRADCWGAFAAGLDSMYVHTEQSPALREPLPENCRVLGDISEVYPPHA